MSTMVKPVPENRPSLDFSDCTAFIEDKYGIDTRDYARSHLQFGEWCDAKGYGEKDPDGNDRSSSQVWFAEFKKDVEDGAVVERPYQDFWHWLLEVCDIHRGATMELYEGIEENAEPWQKEILGCYLSEFGRGPYLTDW